MPSGICFGQLKSEQVGRRDLGFAHCDCGNAQEQYIQADSHRVTARIRNIGGLENWSDTYSTADHTILYPPITIDHILLAELNIRFQRMPFSEDIQMNKGLPTIWSWGTKPQTRLSSELCLLSPIAQ